MGGSILIFVSFVLGAQQEKAPVDRDLIQKVSEASKSYWQSIATMKLTSDDYVPHDDGKVVDPSVYTRYRFLMTADGKRSLSMKGIGVLPEREVTFLDCRNDSTVTVDLIYNLDNFDLDRVTRTKKSDESTVGVNTMFKPMFFLMPFAKPVYAHIEAGAKLSRTLDSDILILTISENHRTTECYLNRKYDWMIEKLDINHGHFVTTVSKFELVQGRWFPMEGESQKKPIVMKDVDLQEPPRKAFKVKEIRFNEPIEDSAFKMPAILPVGTIIDDKIAKKQTVVGGNIELKKKLVARFGVLSPTVGAIKPATIEPGGEFEVDLDLTIKTNYHIYANPAGSDDVIPTVVTLPTGSGATLVEVRYPPGESKVLAASGPARVTVYEKKVTPIVRIRVSPETKSGPATFTLKIRYQACDDKACLAPATLDVPVTVEVKAK